ncbi:leucyl-tRNA synthetase, mitochondrial [Oratosquilla oratoria]|uniref:leucyl-tRNA synthetase, mitochondrial n=1 Tax=Oratosquilla oratoria TaxID=337810 RepID=UPI003F77165A
MKNVKWSSYLLSCAYQRVRLPHFRSIFSKTGIWDEELTSSVKKEIEFHWRENFSKVSGSVAGDDGRKEKKYVLAMFPYPSGKLHMGHVRVYTISDAMARFYHMKGFKVIHPMGWDAFGLPAENAAIERGEAPDKWTHDNIAYMRKQLQDLGCKFDWEREFATCDPEYYHWTQFLFLKLYNAGYAYQQEATVNWDPVDQTVLADEQVDDMGNSWRSGAKVEKRLLKQWFIKTTNLSKSLFDGLSDPLLQDWRDITKLQEHWIGDCTGYIIEMELYKNDVSLGDKLSVWMAEPEFLDGLSFIGVRTSHRLNKEDFKGVGREGVDLLNISAVHPFSKHCIPIVVSDSFEYLEDAELYTGVPCQKEQDKSFAMDNSFAYVDVELVGSKEEARTKVVKRLREMNAGGQQTSVKLRDWLISRQRYWGTPIPVVHCSSCGTVPVPENELPITLPKISKLLMKGTSPLQAPEWKHCICPGCGGPAERETDTMDTFVDSSWYFLRFLDRKNKAMPFDSKIVDELMPVDLYVGGKEHAVLHLYYARFIQHFLASQGYVKHKEPFKRLLVQGMVMGQSYKTSEDGRYLTHEQIDFSVNPPVEKDTGASLIITFEKMSKSKHNGIDPQMVFDEYGSDTTRLLMLADVAPTSHRNWSTETFPGILNWQKRLWMTLQAFIRCRTDTNALSKQSHLPPETVKKHEDYLFDSRNYYIKGVTHNFQVTHQLSVAISKMQGLTNSLRKVPLCLVLGEEYERTLATQIMMLAPIMPHFATELWAGLCSVATSPHINKDVELLSQKWPEVEPSYHLDFVCKINGREAHTEKLERYNIDALNSSTATELALDLPSVKKILDGRTVIGSTYDYIPGYEASLNLSTESSFAFEATPRKKVKGKKKKKKVKTH